MVDFTFDVEAFTCFDDLTLRCIPAKRDHVNSPLRCFQCGVLISNLPNVLFQHVLPIASGRTCYFLASNLHDFLVCGIPGVLFLKRVVFLACCFQTRFIFSCPDTLFSCYSSGFQSRCVFSIEMNPLIYTNSLAETSAWPEIPLQAININQSALIFIFQRDWGQYLVCSSKNWVFYGQLYHLVGKSNICMSVPSFFSSIILGAYPVLQLRRQSKIVWLHRVKYH